MEAMSGEDWRRVRRGERRVRKRDLKVRRYL